MTRSFAGVAVAAAVTMIGACGLSPRPDPTTFLVLAPGAAAVAMPTIARPDLRIGVGPVTIPTYLDRPQFVTRVDATELQVNEFARWAAPLAALIAETVGANLETYLAVGDVVLHPWNRARSPHYGVRITLQQFEVTAADSVVMAGRWDIVDGAGTVVAGPESVRYGGRAGPGPKGGAFALSELLARMSADVAGALRTLPGGE
jgi:uncharacterized lipoprotein YmbA